MKERKRLGDILVGEKVITKQLLEMAVVNQQQTGKRIGDFLVDLGYTTPEIIAKALAIQYRLPFKDLSKFTLSPELAGQIPEKIMTEQKVVPFEKVGPLLRVALADPDAISALLEFKEKNKLDLRPFMAVPGEVDRVLTNFFDQGSSAELDDLLRNFEQDDFEVVKQVEEDDLDHGAMEGDGAAPVIKLVNLIVAGAIRTHTSDIHIEPKEKRIELRYRIDGILQEQKAPPRRMHNQLVSRLKIMSDLDISERRRPQDGRFKIKMGNNLVDFRVSILPTIFGEKVVLRLLDKSNLASDISELGLEPETERDFISAIEQPFGIVLVTGPTGSGKTTTLYSALQRLASPEKNVITIEDPVEYELEAVNQVQVRAEYGLDFSDVLRSVLRQDPDVVMVGEIRDNITMDIAIKAALTGHLVLSTLHTNNATSTITRIIEMGVPNYMLTAAVNCILAQRLVRRVCLNCRESYEPDEAVLRRLNIDPKTCKGKIFRGVGCDSCYNTGYKGRVGLVEALPINDALKAMIMEGKTAPELEEFALQEQGMINLRICGVRKVLAGITTPEEVLSATFD